MPGAPMKYRKLIKSSEEEKAYHAFMLKYELYSLRLACIFGSIHTLLFLIIDYWRVSEYQYVFASRSSMIIVLLICTWRALKINTEAGYTITVISMNLIVVFLSFVMDWLADIPQFFLPNFLCLLFYVFNAGLGHRLWIKSVITIFLSGCFILYSIYYSPDKHAHLSQGWNIMVNAVISMVIAYLIERYKRLNFTQRLELLNARKRIEKLNNLKTRLISIMSHDLVTPLSNLKSLLHLRTQNVLSAEEMNNYYGQVGRSVDGATFMLHNLLKWSKTLLEGERLDKVPVDVKRIASEVIEFVRDQSGPKQITVQNDIESGISVNTDPEVLKIILRNLLSNSIKYSHPNSLVTIKSQKNNGVISLSVHDEGLGMAHEDVKNLFTLRKNNKKGTNSELGTGIGLVLTKEFADMLGLSIDVQSEEGMGSTFFIKFPMT